MKRVTILSLITVSVILTAGISIDPQSVTGSKSSISVNTEATLPDSINKFVQRACMDCHSDDGNFLAKGKVNFSSWDKYDSAKQISKANSMCKELTKSAMPPKKWRKRNPDDIPTQAEVDMVCKWVNALQK
ncbi:MAG: heme-binding domain-containing protein [Bacteroidales bacterium]|nr:heme-binding domain-containing protein [Bacteroidales bacterium]